MKEEGGKKAFEDPISKALVILGKVLESFSLNSLTCHRAWTVAMKVLRSLLKL